jgi:hypothetical protein
LLDALFRGVNAVLPVVQQAAVPLQPSAAPGRVSACPWEPLSEQELEEGVGSMQLVALVSIEDDTSSSTSTSNSSSSCSTGICGPVQGTVLQQLNLSPAGTQSQVLQLSQQSQHKQGPSTGHHARRRSSAVAAAAAGSEGVAWGIHNCPAAVLQALHEAASAALKQQLASALECASAMQVSLFEYTAFLHCLPCTLCF